MLIFAENKNYTKWKPSVQDVFLTFVFFLFCLFSHDRTPKIVVKGKDTPELMDIEAQAKHAGIPNYLVCDAGRTQVRW